VDQCMRKRSTITSRNLGLSSQKETQSERDSCTSCLMHKTRSCAHTLHKDRVRGERDGAGKVRWKKLFKGWTTLNEIWRGAVGRRMGRKTNARNAHASKLTEACWSRKESLGPGNPGHQRSGTVGETR
jgi:hypothetical protein